MSLNPFPRSGSRGEDNPTREGLRDRTVEAETLIEDEERLVEPSGEEAEQIHAIGPWALAWRRLRRNRIALAFLGLFILLVVICLLAPVYSSDIAHMGPNQTNVTGTIKINGKVTNVVSTDGIPIGHRAGFGARNRRPDSGMAPQGRGGAASRAPR